MKEKKRCSICKGFGGDDGLCTYCREKTRSHLEAPHHIVSAVYHEDQYIKFDDPLFEEEFGCLKDDFGIMRGLDDGT